jgi:hypothetical protein
MKRAYLPIVLFCFAIFVSACGGGSGSSNALPHSGGNNVQQTTGATVHVVIPKSSTGSSARRPNFIASNTATITIGVYTVNGATPSPLPSPASVTIATSPDCTSTSGSTSCTITVTVPVATAVMLQLSTYDESGNLLGQALIGPINTTLATIPTQSVSVGGVPASFAIAPASLSATDDGATHQISFTVTAIDASGNTIIPPGAYPNPISLTISGDTNGALTLSPTSIASPGNNGASTVTLSYNSAKVITTATITAAYGSVTASVPFAPIVSVSGGGALVAPSYTIDKYPIPAPSGGPPQVYGLTTGPDGQSLWAVDRGDQTLDVIASPSACNTSTCNVAAVVTAVFSPPPLFGYSYYDVQSILTAPDGNLYVGDVGNGSTDLGGVYQVTGCSAANAMCNVASAPAMPLATPQAGPMIAGPDGNLYVGSEYPDSSFGSGVMYSSIAGCCSFNYFQLPVPTSGTYDTNGFSVDASGTTLWFTDGGTGNVGFMPIPCTGNCSITELPVNTSQCQQCGVSHRTPIVHAAKAGKKIVHPYKQQRVRYIISNPPALSTALNGIVSGPDGYLYIADAGSHTIDQIDPTVWDGASSGTYTPCSSTCAYTPIPLPQTSGIPMNLTVGADGNIWFTDTTGYVGFVSLTTCASSSGCKAFEYYVGGTPWGIAAGADGNVWFTFSSEDSSFNSIGKVVLQ